MIQRVVLSDQVKEELLEGIMSGQYQPGDRLVESQIARRMGISQSPVREALRDLAAMRFVEVLPHKGARVRPIERSELLQIYAVRAALEELAGNLAVERVADSFDDLEEAVARMTEAFADRNARRLAHWDVRFHRTILEASGNQILIDTWNSLMIEARTFVTLNNLIVTRPDIDLAERHRPIINALKEGDPVEAGAVMRSHVLEFEGFMREVLQDLDGDDLILRPKPSGDADAGSGLQLVKSG